MPKIKKVRQKYKYNEPSAKEIQAVINSSRCILTDKSTNNWVMQLERFRKDLNLNGKIEDVKNENELEEQLVKFIVAMHKVDGKEYKAQSIKVGIYAIARHLSEHSVIQRVNILNQEKFYKLWQIINGKYKQLVRQGLGEKRGASPLTEVEVAEILAHPLLDTSTPEGLLYRVFFRNAILLLLRGGEHYKLLASSFKRKGSGGFNVYLYESKANQRDVNHSDAQADVLYISDDDSNVIQDYENYFAKRPLDADSQFYLQPNSLECGIFFLIKLSI
jgi:hypothetical protein